MKILCDHSKKCYHCSAVHRRCAYQSSSRFSYEVRSGEEFINLERTGNCSRCLCRDGQPKLCVRLPDVICHRLNPSPVSDRSCTVRGRTLAHGDSIIVSYTAWYIDLVDK